MCVCALCRCFSAAPVIEFGGVMSARLCGNCFQEVRAIDRSVMPVIECEISMRVDALRVA